MSGGDDEPAEDWRTNLLRVRLGTAASTAETALDDLGARSGNPLSGPLQKIEDGAWQSPSYQRTKTIDELDGAGDAIKSAFDTAATDLGRERDNEPSEIDVANDEPNAWKTSYSSIDSRTGFYPPAGGPGPYL